MNIFFDKIYAINAPWSTERKSFIINQFDKFHIKDYEIVEAESVDHGELKREQKLAYPGNTFHCDESCTCSGKGHGLSRGNVSLSVTNYKIYKDIIKNKYQNCLIIEDDCIFTDEMKKFDEIIKEVPAG